MRRAIALTLVVVAGVLVAAFLATVRFTHQTRPAPDRDGGSQGRLALDRDWPAVPFVFVYMLPAYPVGNEEVIGGLKVAVWQDGRIVRARSPGEVGKAYIQGRLKPEQLDELIRSIDQTGALATRPDDSSPMHAASNVLTIRVPGGPLVWVDSVPAMENARVKQIDQMLNSIEVSDASPVTWEPGYPSEWRK